MWFKDSSKVALDALQMGVVRFSLSGKPLQATGLAVALLGGDVHLDILLREDLQPMSDQEHPILQCRIFGTSGNRLVGVPSVQQIRWVRIRCAREEDSVICFVTDATEEQHIRQTALLASLLEREDIDKTQIGIWELNLDTQRLHWDDVTCRIHEVGLGHRPSLKESIQYYASQSRSVIQGCVQAALDKGESWDQEVTLVTSTGRRIWVRTIGKTLMKEGVCMRLYGCIMDITIRKRAELDREAARARALEFENLCQSAHDLMVVMDQDGTLLTVNDAWNRTLGYDCRIIIGRPFMSKVHPADQETTIAAGQRVLAGEPCIGFINRYQHHNGTWVWLEWTATSEVDGHIYATARDITALREQKRLLRRLAMIASSTQNAALITDRRGVLEWVNQGFTRMTGYTPEEAIGKKPGTLLQGPNSNPEIVRFMSDHLQRGEGFTTELINYHKSGTPYWVSLEVQPIYDEDVLVGFMGIEENITERKKSEAALIEARNTAQLHARQAHRANQAKSAFLATMSHELRTPMNGVLGTVQLLAQTRLNKEQHELVTTIQSSGDALLVILNDILDFSKIEADRMQLTAAPFDLDELLRTTMNLLQPSALQKGITLSMHSSPQLYPHRIGDALRIKQVLTNLLSNAIKFTEQGGVELTISAIPDGVRIAVQDTGIGISSDDQDRLFDPFTQVDTSATRRFSGTGLGLAICSRLVSLMGGTIRCMSELGVGSTFSIELPLEEAPPVQRLPEPTPTMVPVSLNNVRVLVAEDNAINQLVVNRMLQQLDCQVEIVENGELALKRLREKTFDLVLMDCHMPVLDGWAATRARRKEERSQGLSPIPIVALTANAMRGDREKCMEAGMNDYLPKPIRIQALQETLSRFAPSTSHGSDSHDSGTSENHSAQIRLP